MKTFARYTPDFSTTLLGLAIVVLFLFLAAPAFAQNTKGDNPSAPKRENRFKVGTKKKQKNKDRTKRIRSKSKSVANSGTQYKPRRRAAGGERAGKPIKPLYKVSRPDNKQRPWKGDITGRRIRQKGTSGSGRYIHPQRGRYVRRTVPDREGRQNVTRERIQAPSQTGRVRNTFPQRGRYTHNPSSRPRDTQQAVSNRRQLARARQMQRSTPRTSTVRQAKVKPRSASRPYIRNKSINAFANFKRPQRKGERAVTKDLAGRPLRTKNYETPRPRITAPATSPVRRKRIGDRPYSGPAKGRQRTVEPGFRRNKSINVYANFRRPKKKGERAVTKDLAGRRLRTKNYETPRPGIIAPAVHPGRRKRAGDRPYGGASMGKFGTAARPREWAWTGDIANRRIRHRDRSSKRSIEGKPVLSQGYRSASKSRRNKALPALGKGGFLNLQRRGNVRVLQDQGEEFTGNIKVRRGGLGEGLGGKRSGARARAPFISADGTGLGKNKSRRKTFADQGEEFTGFIKSKRSDKGGGSVGRRGWNNQGNPIPSRVPRNVAGQAGLGKTRSTRKTFADQGEEFSGLVKLRRSDKGGGSVSGKRWNNQGNPIPVRVPASIAGQGGLGKNRSRQKTFSDQGEEFSGLVKLRRSEKGGGSVSGKRWNNRGNPIPVRIPASIAGQGGLGKNRSRQKTFSDQGEEFSGLVKFRRPEKGGGSVSGKRWNNRGNPIPVRVPLNIAGQGGLGKTRFRQKTFSDQGEEFSGFVKVKRSPGHDPRQAGLGKIKTRARSFVDQGEEYTGHLKVDRTKGSVVYKPKDFPRSEKRTSAKPDFLNQGEEFTGYVRLPRFKRNYVRNKNAHEESMLKKRPDKSVYEVGGLQVSVRQKQYVKNKNAAEESLLKVKPARTVREINELQVKVKSYHYKHNPNSADEALKTREPGKAFARATQYQGNIKMQKFSLFAKNRELHPDAQFVKLNRNNVAGEKNAVTNFKLWWARLFRKQETQPDHLKEKNRKPRYDDGEQGLWYD